MKKYPIPDRFADAVTCPDRAFKSLFGRQAIKGWADLRQIEAFLRCIKPKHIIEIGCGEGTHTLYLGLWSRLNGGRVDAYDINTEWREAASIGDFPINWFQQDVFDVAFQKHLAPRIAQLPGPLLLYCDNGNKPREVAELRHGEL